MSLSSYWTENVTNLRLDLGAREPGGYVDVAFFGTAPSDDIPMADGFGLRKK